MRRTTARKRESVGHPITRSPDHPIFFPALLASILLLAAACGKKGDPSPPLARGPKAVTDLAVEQEAADTVLTFTYPDRLLTGEPLTDLEAIEVWRVVDPASALTAPRPPSRAPVGPKTDEAPGAAARRAAMDARLAEQNFYRDAERVAILPIAEIARRTRGAILVYNDSLAPLYRGKRAPTSLAYAVVSVRRTKERSPLSNIATLSPAIPPGAPTLLAVTPEEGRICLEWLSPSTDLVGRSPVEVGGYYVYRRALPDEEYDRPLNAKPFEGTAYVDTAAPYGSKLIYTVRAIPPGKPKIEGPPAEEAAVDYRDVFPPPPPARLDALPERSLVRLVWDPVAAPDLAGYLVFRAEGSGAPARLTPQPIRDPFFTDETVKPGQRYRYTVRAIDNVGNMSAPSPEALAEPF